MTPSKQAKQAGLNSLAELSQITTKYRSMYAAAKALNVSAMQLKRLVDKGALVNDDGVVYIPSTSKINLVGAVNHDL